MTNLSLSFRAQSLDNQSPDPVEINGEILEEEDVDKRQELIKKISKVSQGTKVFSEDVHTAFLHGDEFILQTPSDQLDAAGRISPILCYGHGPDEPSPGEVVEALVRFAEDIDRTISDVNKKKAHQSVEAIVIEKKKRRNRKILWLAAALLIVFGPGKYSVGGALKKVNPFTTRSISDKSPQLQSGERTVTNDSTLPEEMEERIVTDNTWPNEPHRRKTVLVLNQQDSDALDYERGGADLLLNEEIYILSASSRQSNPVVQRLFSSGIARPGAVLVQSPFDVDVYQNAQQAVELFAYDRHMYLSELCSILGARQSYSRAD